MYDTVTRSIVMSEPPVTLEFSREGRAAHLTLNRPDKNNAIDRPLLSDLVDHVEEIDDAPDVRVATVRGAGGTFSTGVDLAELQSVVEDGDRDAVVDFLEVLHESLDILAALPVPTVAVVERFALAGGLETMLACDLALCSSEARIGDQHANFGLVAGGGATQRLPDVVGPRRAKELMFTGRHLSAEEAREWGLVNRVADPANLDAEVESLIDEFATKSPDAAAVTKDLVNGSRDLDRESGLELERERVGSYLVSEDAREGLAAFETGRDPDFS